MKVVSSQWSVVGKIVFCFAFGALLFALSSVADAQQLKKVPRIGWLAGNLPYSQTPRIDVFRQGLREFGYVEGKNIIIEARYNRGELNQLPELAAELVRLKVDLIVAIGTQAAQAAQNSTKTIPIVATSGDLVASGLVASLAHPGGNITGLANLTFELAPKRLELLKEAVPNLSRVGVLWSPDSRNSAQGLPETEAAARSLGITLQSVSVKRGDDVEGAFSAMRKERASAFMLLRSPLILSQIKRIVELETQNRLPAMFDDRAFPDAGGLMSYGTLLADLDRRLATYVDKILKGAKPADLPVEQPKKFEFIINLKAAKQIGLTIPPNVLARADKVIK
jgi:putative tryptophan/tyrosine transport system substrate-binding protein